MDVVRVVMEALVERDLIPVVVTDEKGLGVVETPFVRAAGLKWAKCSSKMSELKNEPYVHLPYFREFGISWGQYS